MKRIYNGFTAESQRTNDGPSFANRLPPYGGGRGERPSLFPLFTLQNYNIFRRCPN